jgi:hypothetical protein
MHSNFRKSESNQKSESVRKLDFSKIPEDETAKIKNEFNSTEGNSESIKAASAKSPHYKNETSKINQIILTHESLAKKDYFTKKIVKPNDYLSKIALDTYGVSNDTIIDLIHIANPVIKNVNKIYSGQRILLPQITKNDLIVKDETGSYQIHYASFYNLENANRTFKDIIKRNEKAILISFIQGETPVYRIYLGLFKSREQAETNLNSLQFKELSFLNKN